MNKDEFHADVLETLRAAYSDLTDAQRRTVADKILAKELADVFPLWDWTNAERRREQVDAILFNMKVADADLFRPPPTGQQIYDAKVAALQKQLGDDKGNPAHPANPQARRTLYRECQALTPDEHAEAAKSLKIPKAEQAPPEAAVSPTAPKRFSEMTLLELDAEAARRWGGSFAVWTPRNRARYHDMLRNSDPRHSEAEKIVREASSKGGPSNLSPAERRTAFRAKLRLAEAK